jgi:hypothetical protein
MGLSPTDWNIGLSLLCRWPIFHGYSLGLPSVVTFSIGGPACNALVKIIGPRYTLSATFMGVAVTIFGMGFANQRAEWFALRLRMSSQ